MPGVMTGGNGPVAVVDVPLAPGKHRRVFVAELVLILADDQ